MRIHPGIVTSTGLLNSAEVQQFFDRLIKLPVSARQTLYVNLINTLVADGTWQQIDALYIFAAADSGTSLVNLKQSNFPAELWAPAAAPTFVVDRGWLTAGINQNVTSNFNPSTGTGNFTQNSASVGTWSLTSTQANSMIIGTRTQTTAIELFPRWSNDSTYWNVNGSSEQTSSGVTNSSGWFFIQRTASNAQAVYRNDSLLTNGSKTNASSSLVNETIHFTGPYRHAASVIGGSLSSSQKTTLYTAIQTYLTAVGAI